MKGVLAWIFPHFLREPNLKHMHEKVLGCHSHWGYSIQIRILFPQDSLLVHVPGNIATSSSLRPVCVHCSLFLPQWSPVGADQPLGKMAWGKGNKCFP